MVSQELRICLKIRRKNNMNQDFQIDTQIYSLEKIQEAVEDFKESIDIEFQSNILTLHGDSEEEIQEVFHEFMNYVLSL